MMVAAMLRVLYYFFAGLPGRPPRCWSACDPGCAGWKSSSDFPSLTLAATSQRELHNIFRRRQNSFTVGGGPWPGMTCSEFRAFGIFPAAKMSGIVTNGTCRACDRGARSAVTARERAPSLMGNRACDRGFHRRNADAVADGRARSIDHVHHRGCDFKRPDQSPDWMSRHNSRDLAVVK